MKRDFERQQKIAQDPLKSGLYVKYMAYGLVSLVAILGCVVGSDTKAKVTSKMTNKKED